MNSLLLLVILLVPTDQPRPGEFARQSEFQRRLEQPLSVHRQGVAIDEILRRLSEDRKIALLRDRRIDPSTTIDVALNAARFDDAVRGIAQGVLADLAVAGDTLYVAPVTTARTFRTRAVLLRDQLDALTKADSPQQFQRSRRFPLRWDRLTTPRELLDLIAHTYGIEIENRDAVPHDLWDSGAMGYANVHEALLFILTQFDLSLQWITPERVRIVEHDPIPVLTRRHRPRGMSQEDALALVTDQFPDAEVVTAGRALEIKALLEEHEEIEIVIGERTPIRSTPAQAPATPIGRRRFTLTMVRQPFSALIGLLRQQGIEVVADANSLAAAGIELNQKISLQLEKATADEMLTQACNAVGVKYRIDGLRVVLFVDVQ